MRLQNKIAIITGAGSGMGRSIALAFVKEGAKVVVADWSEKGGKETVEQIRKIKGESVFVKTDVSKAADIDRMAKTCLDKFGRIDILVNNAGIFPKLSMLHETTEEDFDTLLTINLKGVFLGSKRVIPEMLKQGQGKIINTASVGGLVGFEFSGPYGASKGGIIALTRTMALEYAKQKININCIAPGTARTPMMKDILAIPAIEELLESSSPYPRLAEPEDVAHAAVYLASGESDFVTGHALVVDVGWIAR